MKSKKCKFMLKYKKKKFFKSLNFNFNVLLSLFITALEKKICGYTQKAKKYLTFIIYKRIANHNFAFFKIIILEKKLTSLKIVKLKIVFQISNILRAIIIKVLSTISMCHFTLAFTSLCKVEK